MSRSLRDLNCRLTSEQDQVYAALIDAFFISAGTKSGTAHLIEIRESLVANNLEKLSALIGPRGVTTMALVTFDELIRRVTEQIANPAGNE